MNREKLLVGACTMILLLTPFSPGFAGWGDLLKTVQEAVEGSSGPSRGEIVDGLKQALEIGTGNTVRALSRLDGYYGHPEVNIPLPQSVQTVEKLLRTTGFGPQLDAFELSMNRAAEKAAPEAEALFVDAIKAMTFADAQQILKGADDAATVYFRDKTADQLQALFKPIVHASMDRVGVTRTYRSLSEKMETLPFAADYAVDLDDYVTGKSIDGLFIRLAQEEARIRNDPAARVTELLQKVFR
ncbi:hypothetical protein DSCA_52900 [Desulfosarcina alkanivorans]|jgi:hypothetical protein|uniref:DUF4197 domain-containing protein n=1 Tax=Desulfosarcina alkanivorans TaxID=571177 RepID=A0A5K7YST0_9BACT|nr:DUF4197 domain-containing protein [Desulfosarcina alkanivorans]BBO71360.1 hypothetical protein DSCA_52900 [Desulfosarcina alkanivorans]